jgi:tellurite resistance protein TerC
MSLDPTTLWIAFGAVLVVMLALDLGVLRRKPHVMGFREALGWSAVWVALALAFAAGVHVVHGRELALEFLAGYLIEKSLSVDNLFVFLLVFAAFRVPAAHQPKILAWGVVGAIAMRGALIAVGAALVHQFHWVLYLFGAFLVYTAWRMAFQPDAEVDPGENALVRWVRRVVPVTADHRGGRFFVREDGKLAATTLFLALLVVEASDLVFAVDSIPAIFAVTTDPFIVFTSNVFAILGLRALYFALAGVLDRFAYFKYGLAGVLGFVGTKMLIADVYKIPVGVALAVVAGILGTALVASWLAGRGRNPAAAPEVYPLDDRKGEPTCASRPE